MLSSENLKKRRRKKIPNKWKREMPRCHSGMEWVCWCVIVRPRETSRNSILAYFGHETSKAFASIGLEELGFQVTRASTAASNRSKWTCNNPLLRLGRTMLTVLLLSFSFYEKLRQVQCSRWNLHEFAAWHSRKAALPLRHQAAGENPSTIQRHRGTEYWSRVVWKFLQALGQYSERPHSRLQTSQKAKIIFIYIYIIYTH